MHTNIAIEESEKIEVLEIPGSATKSYLRLIVTNCHFKYNRNWFTQSDGLAMGASLAVVLAKFCTKPYEKSLQKENE